MSRATFTVSLLLMLAMPAICRADSAEVLPKGVWRVGLEDKIYFPTSERFNPDGGVEDIAVDYNRRLNSGAFPILSKIDKAFGLPDGYSCIGTSRVSFEYEFNILEFSLQYGITDKLSAGILVPYWWLKNNVEAELDSSTATVGKNAKLNTIVPLSIPGTVPLTREDVLNLLSKGIDINKDGKIDVQGYGYQKLGTITQDGFSNVEAGLRYQYLKTKNWRLAFTGGIRFPTAEVENPDDLADFGTGENVWGLLFRLNNDFTGIKNLLLNATFRYDLLLPDSEEKRVPLDVNEPITLNREVVDRDLGDVFEFEASATYTIYKGLNLWAQYKYGFQLEDEVSGDKGFNYQSLEDETAATEHVYYVGVSYSTIELYKERKFPIPLSFSFYFRDRFAGSNNVLKSQYLGISLAAYF